MVQAENTFWLKNILNLHIVVLIRNRKMMNSSSRVRETEKELVVYALKFQVFLSEGSFFSASRAGCMGHAQSAQSSRV
jgi:hypothetical protein